MRRLFKKIIFVAGTIAVLLFSVQPASAGVPTVDWATMSDFALHLLEYTSKPAGRIMAKVAFDVMANQIVIKAKTSGRNGGASFVQNWRNYQTEAQYRGEDVFRALLANTKFCNYLNTDIKATFRVNDKFKISLTGQNTRSGDLDPYTLRARCTLPSNFDVAKYQKDFGGNGGWSAFIRMLEPQNNPTGSWLLAQDELQKQRNIEVTADTNEALSGAGYTSIRADCQKNGLRCVFLGKIKSPGNLLSDSVSAAITKQLDWFTSSHNLEDMVAQVLTNVVIGQLTNLADASESPTQDLQSIKEANQKMEYCTARKPRASVIDKYKDLFDPYGRIADGKGVCGDPKKDNTYPYQECIQACLQEISYYKNIPTTPNIPDASEIYDIPENTGGESCQDIDVGGPVCKDNVTTGCRAYCLGAINGAPEGCGSFTNGSTAYLLAAGHLSLDTKSNKLFNPGSSGSSDYRDWEWFRAPDRNDADAWCEPDRLESTSPPSQAPIFPALARCADGSTGGLATNPSCTGTPAGGGGGGGGGGGTPASGQCQRELPAGQSGPYGGDIQSILTEIANSGSGILDKNDVSGGSYKILNFEAYMGELENKLRGRGYVFVRRDTNDTREMMMKRSDSDQYAQQYNLARSGDYTRVAHKGLNCTP